MPAEPIDTSSVFLDALDNPDPGLRALAADALGRTTVDHPAVVPTLLETLTDPDCEVRAAASAALGRKGSADPRVVAALCDLMRSDPSVRVRAVTALSLSNSGHPAAGDTLRAALEDTDHRVRRDAAWALGRVAGAAEHSAPALAAVLLDADPSVRYWSACSLQRLEHPCLLAASLLDPDPAVRLVAQQVLTMHGVLLPSRDVGSVLTNA